MLENACVAAAFCLLLGCSRRDEGGDLILPAFAAKLPGQTAVCVFGLDQDLPQDLIASLTERMPSGEGARQLNRLGQRVVYPDLPDARTGWPSLADSANFRQALEIAPADARILVYLDLQLISARLMRDFGEQIPPQSRGLVDALYLDEFQCLIASVDAQGDAGYRIHGSIETSGSGAGLSGLFPAAARELSLLAGAAPDDMLRVELQIDPKAVQRLISDFVSHTGQDLLSSMMSQVVSAMVKVGEQVLQHLSGRISIRIDSARDWGLAAEVSDPNDMINLLDRRLPEESGDAWKLPGELPLRMRGNLLLAGPLAEQQPADFSGQRDVALFLRSWFDGRSYEFELDPGVERLDFRLLMGR